MTRTGLVSTLSLGATLLASSAVLAQGVISARPGMLNYVEGTASLADASGQPGALTAGKTLLAAGQQLETTDGKAEVLLTPGVYARVGENSTLRMVSPQLTRTEIAVEHGTLEVEVDDIYKQNDLLVDVGHARVRLQKRGLYEFDADAGTVRTLYGQADVQVDGQSKPIEVKGGRLLALSNADGKPEKFDEKRYTDPLTDWSSLRSQYLGQANQEVAASYASNGFGAAGYGPGFGMYSGLYGGYGPGWAWSPGLLGYTWLPGAGLAWSPFGYGFYSAPYLYGGGYVYGPGVYGGGFGTGYYSRPYRRSFANQGVTPGLAGHPVDPGSLPGGLAGRTPVSAAGLRSGIAAGAALRGQSLPAGGFRGQALPAGGFHGNALPAGNFHGGAGGGGGFHPGAGGAPHGGAAAGGGFHSGGGGGGMAGGGGHAGGGGGGHR